MQRASPADLQNLYSEIGFEDTDSAPLITNYDAAKGAVDHSNEDLYRYIRLTGHRHWESTTVVSILHAMALNAWSLHDEWLLTTALRRNPNLTKPALHGMRRSFYEFITAALAQAGWLVGWFMTTHTFSQYGVKSTTQTQCPVKLFGPDNSKIIKIPAAGYKTNSALIDTSACLGTRVTPDLANAHKPCPGGSSQHPLGGSEA
jgi:hypothetical protein